MESTSQNRKAIRFKVIKHLPLGLLVELEDGRSGIIRVREISWDAQERQNWQQLCPVNWSDWALPLDNGEMGHLELSLRMVRDNPWEHIASQLVRGQALEGTVTGVLKYGAFVELSSGLTGLLHRLNLPEWISKDQGPLDLFWPGDHVRVVIQDINRSKRRLGLGLMVWGPAAKEAAQSDGDSRRSAPGITRGRSSLDKFLHANHEKKHVLIIEDEEDQAGAIAAWLEHVGQRVDVVGTGQEGLARVALDPPDIALVDVELPDINGIDVAHRLLEEWPQVYVILTTDWAEAEKRMQQLESLQNSGVSLQIKPLLPEDLLDILTHSRPQPTAGYEEQPGLKGDFSFLELAKLSHNRSIKALLSQCQGAVGFEAAVLFAVDSLHRSVEVIQKSGDGFDGREAISSLIYSPVRDIAEDGESISMEQCTEDKRDRFRYLLEFYPLESCIGVPVPGNFARRYALIFMDTKPKRITPEMCIYVSATGLAIGSVLDRMTFEERAVVIQRTTLLGHLTKTLVHEINNRVSNLVGNLDRLENYLDGIEASPTETASITPARIELAHKMVAGIQSNVNTIVQSTRMFARILQRPKNELLRLDEIILETIRLLSDQSHTEKVMLKFTPPEKMILVRTQAAALEQILLNLILNAIQQIAGLHHERGGVVVIRVETFSKGDKLSFFRVLIEDNGPGIHRRLWEQVFEPGYTTREDGSGIGLYISQSLVEALGGKIYVSESFILGGTTFAVELPSQI